MDVNTLVATRERQSLGSRNPKRAKPCLHQPFIASGHLEADQCERSSAETELKPDRTPNQFDSYGRNQFVFEDFD